MGAIVGTTRTHDGLTLRTLRWPAKGTARAELILVHGVGEHAGRYDDVARQMAEAGIEVAAFDMRGFGASGGPRAYVRRWTDFHDDLESRMLGIADDGSEGPVMQDGPTIVYGHSMGGLIALGYMLSDEPRLIPGLLILTSPALDSTIAAWEQRAAAILGRIAPRLRLPIGFGPGALSRDPRVDERVKGDPLCQSTSTARLGAEGFAEQRRVRAALAEGRRLPVPTYVIHGGDDPIVPVEASAVLEQDPMVTRRVYPGLRHETHNEPEGPSVTADTIEWIRANTPLSPQ
jgi:acylglycerol lipase